MRMGVRQASEVKAAEVAKQLIEKGLEIKNLKPEIVALAGDDEKKAWDNIFEKQGTSKAKNQGKGGRGGE